MNYDLPLDSVQVILKKICSKPQKNRNGSYEIPHFELPKTENINLILVS